MRLFALADLHLSFATDKPMTIFGKQWEDHVQRVRRRWSELVGDGDLVLMPGDLSWGMTLEEARPDLEFLGRLPGTILLGKGNHDYWWQSLRQVKAALPPNVRVLQNDYYPLPGGRAVCGTRGWSLPGSEDYGHHDEKIYQREVLRLGLSLEAAQKAGLRTEVAMLHFPPLGPGGVASGFSELLERYQVRICVYGHLHGRHAVGAVEGSVGGVTYRLVACDAVGFAPVSLSEYEEDEKTGAINGRD